MVSDNKLNLIIIEDDEEDFEMIHTVLVDNGVKDRIIKITDGDEAKEMLGLGRTQASVELTAHNTIVILDLNLPRTDGREVLRLLRKHPKWKGVPVFVLTTSRSQEDLIESYGLGANIFIRKTSSYEDLIDVLRIYRKAWASVD